MNIKIETHKPQFTISAIDEDGIVATMSLRDSYGALTMVTLNKQDLTVLQNLIASVNHGMINGATYNLGSTDLIVDMPEELKENVMKFIVKQVEEVKE